MNVKRLLIVLLVFSLFAFSACGKSGGSKPADDAATATATPAATSTTALTPTENPKSPEEQDFEAITRLFEAADQAIAGTKDSDGPLPEGTRFLIRFSDNLLVTGFETTDAGFQRRIWENWVRSAGMERVSCPLQSESYRSGCKYGAITGVLNDDRKISWTADNLSDELFASLAAIGVEKAPSYLERVTLSKELVGDWDGVYALSMESLIAVYMADKGNLSPDRYLNFVSFMKQYGFTGDFYFKAHCSILNEKELRFTLKADLSSFYNAMHKAAATEESMTQFLYAALALDEDSLNSILRSAKEDVITFGTRIISEHETLYRNAYNDNIEETCTYTYSNKVLHLEGSRNAIDLRYNSEDKTMTYRYKNWEIILKKQ